MKNNETIGNVLSIEVFLNERYAFRHNVLNGKTEFAKKAEDGSVTEYRVLTQKALNSIVIQAKREDVFEEGGSKSDIQEYINSEEVETFDPIKDYLNGLPQWDGKNHVAKLFSRLPGISSEQLNFLTIWMRSTVAHWLQLDTDHGNECVPTLIGAQGCGKTTFLRRLLPQHLREYYLDHLNLSNKFDKEMALSNNLLVNLDELEAIRPSQHAQLKQTLSKSKVNGRPIYGASQEDRPRYASFVATTNNPHPLTDPTGSRRYICLTIPEGQFIDNAGDIDYDQLYAQVMHELQEDEAPYWFHNDEVARIQQLNQEYMEVKDMAELVEICFRKPNEGEQAKPMSGKEMLKVIQGKYPSLEINHSAKMQLSTAMKELGYESKEVHHSAQYYAIPLAA
jgi:predicted P-loop ATPase